MGIDREIKKILNNQSSRLPLFSNWHPFSNMKQALASFDGSHPWLRWPFRPFMKFDSREVCPCVSRSIQFLPLECITPLANL